MRKWVIHHPLNVKRKAAAAAVSVCEEGGEAKLQLVFRHHLSLSHLSQTVKNQVWKKANYALSGLEPFWFHACNVALHAAASLLFTRVHASYHFGSSL
ncbi:hypothetical protein B566_EDAN001203 [Ephemera danica]|nr:hypothetical protein B566_EDAN001203 [Ephemera danica]